MDKNKSVPFSFFSFLQRDGRIDAGTVTQATALLDNLSAFGSPLLKADLLLLKKEMQSGRLFDEFHISVAGRWGYTPRLRLKRLG